MFLTILKQKRKQKTPPPLVVNRVEKDIMLRLEVQPRVLRVPLVGTNL